MAQQVEFLLQRLDEIVSATGKPLSLPERAALWSAVCECDRVVGAFIDKSRAIDTGYAHEKLGEVLWHTGAALGFDLDNGHPARQHVAWAMGSMESLQVTLAPAIEALR